MSFRTIATLPLALAAVPAAGCGGAQDPAAPPEEPATAPAAAAEPAFERTAWLEAESFVHDFGSVYPQTLQHASFPCVAAGAVPLVVRELKYSCGCTAGELLVLDDAGGEAPFERGRDYPPGTRFRLHATLNTKGRTGVQEQKLTVVLEDGSVDVFTMAAAIEPFLVADPPTIELEEVDPSLGARASFELTARNGERFRPTLWRKVLGESLAVELAALDGGGADDGRAERWRVDLRLAPGSGGETVRAKLIWTADVPNVEAAPEEDGSPALQRLEVLFLASVRPIVRAWPGQLELGRAQAGEALERELVLHAELPELDLGTAEARLVQAIGDAPFAGGTVVAEPREEPGELGLRLRLAPSEAAGPFAGRIVIELGHPLQERLEVPFHGVRSGR